MDFNPLILRKGALGPDLSSIITVMQNFSERFILLKNGACCAVVKQQLSESNLLVVLSPSGAFTNIYYDGNYHKHLTRFTPTRFRWAVARIVAFRNTFASQPFHCKRFGSQEESFAVETTNWRLCPVLPAASSNTHAYLCPLSRRVRTVTEEYIAEDDNCMEYPVNGADVARSYLARISRVYPLHRLPRDVETLIHQAASALAQLDTDSAQRPISLHRAGRTAVAVDSAAETRELLTALMAQMSLVALDRDVYPASVSSTRSDAHSEILSDAGLVAMVEHLDGDIYLVSNAPHDTVPAGVAERRARLLASISDVQRKLGSAASEESVKNTSMHTDLEQTYNGELEVEVWINSASSTDSNENTSANEVILHLKGDYFTFFVYPTSTDTADSTDTTSTTSVIQKTCHSSFLQCELQRRARILDVESECDELYNAYKNANDTKETNTKTHAEAQHYTNAQSEEVDPTHLPDYTIGTLIAAYYRQALKLMRYRDYMLEQAHRCANTTPTVYNKHSSVSSTRSNISALFSVAEDSVNAHTLHTKHIPPSYDTVTDSCSTVTLSTPDGTSFSAVLRRCHTPEEVAHYWFSLLHVPHYNMGEYPHGAIVQSVVAENRVYPCECVTQLTGTFADRTMIKFDPSTQVFSVLFGTGRECSFSLGSFKREEGIFAPSACIPAVDDSFHHSPYGHHPTVQPMHGINSRRPGADELNAPQIAYYVRKLLAFHRYASTAPEHRQAMLDHEEHTRRVARATALQNYRMSMVQSVSSGFLSPQQASQRMREFEHTLDMPRVAPMAQPPIMLSPDRQMPGAVASSSSRSPFGFVTPAPPARHVAVVSGGRTIGSSDHSSLTYSHMSGASPLDHSQTSYPSHRGPHVVSPESVRSYMQAQDSVQHVADAIAGNYLHQNVTINHQYKALGATPTTPARPVAVVSPEAMSRDDIMRRSRELCSERRSVHIPVSPEYMPNYSPALHRGTASYLSETYVKDALDSGARIIAQNKEYLSRLKA